MTICEIKLKKKTKHYIQFGIKIEPIPMHKHWASRECVELHRNRVSSFRSVHFALRTRFYCSSRVYRVVDGPSANELFGNVNFMLCNDKARATMQKLERQIGIISH